MRLATLVTACCASTAVLVSLVIAPQSDYNNVQSGEIPDITPLEDWQPIDPSSPLDIMIDSGNIERVEDEAQYTFEKDDHTVDIHLLYLRSFDGNITQLLADHTNLLDTESSSVTIHTTDADQNFYAVVTDEINEVLHFSACVTANGYTTATPEQFQATRQFGKLSFPQQVEWFLGQRRIEDYRCLLTIASIPLGTSTPAITEAELKAIWQEWHTANQHLIDLN